MDHKAGQWEVQLSSCRQVSLKCNVLCTAGKNALMSNYLKTDSLSSLRGR